MTLNPKIKGQPARLGLTLVRHDHAGRPNFNPVLISKRRPTNLELRGIARNVPSRCSAERFRHNSPRYGRNFRSHSRRSTVREVLPITRHSNFSANHSGYTVQSSTCKPTIWLKALSFVTSTASTLSACVAISKSSDASILPRFSISARTIP